MNRAFPLSLTSDVVHDVVVQGTEGRVQDYDGRSAVETASQTDQYTSRGDNRGGAGTTNNWKSLSLGVIYSYISIYLI